MLLVREAGGFVTDLDGRERTMEAGDIIAGNDTMHREMLGDTENRIESCRQVYTVIYTGLDGADFRFRSRENGPL